MKIIDAIGSAATEHAVHFLVTAYIESLRHFERTSGVPRMVLDLPVSGAADLSDRLDALRRNSDVRLESVVAVSELAAVLACALTRLEALEPELAQADASTRHARSGNPRSALSV